MSVTLMHIKALYWKSGENQFVHLGFMFPSLLIVARFPKKRIPMTPAESFNPGMNDDKTRVQQVSGFLAQC